MSLQDLLRQAIETDEIDDELGGEIWHELTRRGFACPDETCWAVLMFPFRETGDRGLTTPTLLIPNKRRSIPPDLVLQWEESVSRYSRLEEALEDGWEPYAVSEGKVIMGWDAIKSRIHWLKRQMTSVLAGPKGRKR